MNDLNQTPPTGQLAWIRRLRTLARRRIPGRTHRGRGFTLIEVLGVMMIMGLITMALVPSLIREFDRESRSRETRNLERLADGIVQYVMRTRTVPNATNLVAALATQLGMHTNDVVYNDRGSRRVFLMDPAVTNRLPIPFTQTHLGATNTLGTSLGLVILSSVGNALPATLNSGFATNTTFFQNLWNSTEGTIPAGFSWVGTGDDLRIQRINLATLFVPLVLNYDVQGSVTNTGRYTIDNSATNALPTSPVWVSSYLKGTVLGLHDANGATNTVQAREVLQHPMSYVFQNTAWRGTFMVSTAQNTAPSATDLQAAEDTFVNAAANSSAQGSPQTTPTTVVSSMVEYMTNYINWAGNGFPTTTTGTQPIRDAAQDLDDATEDLLHRPDVDDEDDDTDNPSRGHGHDHDDCDHNHGWCNHDGHDHSDCNHSHGQCHHDGRDHSGCRHKRGWCNRDGLNHSRCNHSYGRCDRDTRNHGNCNHSRNRCDHDGRNHSSCSHSRGVCNHDGNNHGYCNHGAGWCNHDGNSHYGCDHSHNRCNNSDDDGSSITTGCRSFWKKGRR